MVIVLHALTIFCTVVKAVDGYWANIRCEGECCVNNLTKRRVRHDSSVQSKLLKQSPFPVVCHIRNSASFLAYHNELPLSSVAPSKPDLVSKILVLKIKTLSLVFQASKKYSRM